MVLIRRNREMGKSNNLRDPFIAEMIRDYINGRKYPLEIIKHHSG